MNKNLSRDALERDDRQVPLTSMKLDDQSKVITRLSATKVCALHKANAAAFAV